MLDARTDRLAVVLLRSTTFLRVYTLAVRGLEPSTSARTIIPDGRNATRKRFTMAGPEPRATLSTTRGLDSTSTVAFKVNDVSGCDAK